MHRCAYVHISMYSSARAVQYCIRWACSGLWQAGSHYAWKTICIDKCAFLRTPHTADSNTAVTTKIRHICFFTYLLTRPIENSYMHMSTQNAKCHNQTPSPPITHTRMNTRWTNERTNDWPSSFLSPSRFINIIYHTLALASHTHTAKDFKCVRVLTRCMWSKYQFEFYNVPLEIGDMSFQVKRMCPKRAQPNETGEDINERYQINSQRAYTQIYEIYKIASINFKVQATCSCSSQTFIECYTLTKIIHRGAERYESALHYQTCQHFEIQKSSTIYN